MIKNFLVSTATLLILIPLSAFADNNPYRGEIHCSEHPRKIRCQVKWMNKRLVFKLKKKDLVVDRSFLVNGEKISAQEATTYIGKDIRHGNRAALTLSENRAILIFKHRNRSIRLRVGKHNIKDLDRSGASAKVFRTRTSRSLGCGSGTLSSDDEDAPISLRASTAAAKTLKLTVYGSKSFFDTFGADAATELQSLLAAVDSVYNSQVSIDLAVTIVVFTSQTITTTTTIETALDDFTDYWNSNRPSDSDAGMFVSTANYFGGSGGAVGVAFLGVICQAGDSFSTSVVQYINQGLSAIIAEHELGHNFNATHTADGTIMDAVVSSSNTNFSQSSINTITSYSDSNNSCLADGASDDGGGDDSNDDNDGGDDSGDDDGDGDGGGGGGTGGDIDDPDSPRPNVIIRSARSKKNGTVVNVKALWKNSGDSMLGCRVEIIGAAKKSDAKNVSKSGRWKYVAQLGASDFENSSTAIVKFTNVKPLNPDKSAWFNAYTVCPDYTNLPGKPKQYRSNTSRRSVVRKASKWLNRLSDLTPAVK